MAISQENRQIMNQVLQEMTARRRQSSGIVRSQNQAIATPEQPEEEQEPKRNVFGKIANFLAPTATRSYEKLQAGEDLTARDVVGSALEIGSFFIPAGGIAKGLGLAGKGALTLGRKIALGAATGAASGATFEAGRTIGQEGTGFTDVVENVATGTVLGGAFGAAIPAAIPAIKGIARAPQTIRRGVDATRRGVQAIGRGAQTAAKAASGLAQEGVTTIGRRIPEKVGQFAEQRAERLARIKGKPIHVQEAVRKNIEQPIIDFVRKANQTDKLQRVRMLETAKKGAENLSFRGQAKQLPGQTILKGPVKYLINVKNSAVKQTQKVLDNLGDKTQNARNIYDQFIQDMAESGVVPIKGRLVPARGSRVPKADLTFYQQVLDDLNPTKTGRVPLTYKQMHQLRQKWFDVAKADKTFTTGPTGYARRLRGLLAREIDNASGGKYLAAQNKTREAIEGLQEYVRLTGYKGRLEDITTKDLKAGEVFLRAFGNAADRPTSVLDKVYATAKRYGYKGNENIYDQLRFADLLEDVYGSPTRALRGQVGRGVADVSDPLSRAASAAREAAKWSPVSAALRLTRGFLAGTSDDTLRAFENMVRAEAGQKIIRQRAARTIGGLVNQTKKAAKPLTDEVKREVQKRSNFGTKKISKTPDLLQKAKQAIKEGKNKDDFVLANAGGPIKKQILDKSFDMASFKAPKKAHGRVKISELTSDEHNSLFDIYTMNKSSKENIDAMADYLKKNPNKDIRPIAIEGEIDDKNLLPKIVDGNHRVAAYIKAGRDSIPFHYNEKTLNDIWNKAYKEATKRTNFGTKKLSTGQKATGR